MIVVASIALVAAVATILWFSPLQIGARVGFRNFVGAAVLVAWAVAATATAIGHRVVERPAADDGLAQAMRSFGEVDWSGQRQGALSPAAGGTVVPGRAGSIGAGATRGVASVQSLIGGLEERLRTGPADATGWALLAQSYAFVGQTDRAEAAVGRAVELGFDESSLRARVDGARRDAHPSGDWITQTLGR